MARTDILAINAKTISINGVPISGSAAPSGLVTTFDQLDASAVLALNGTIIQGSFLPGMAFTNFDNVNVLSGVSLGAVVKYGTASTPASNNRSGPIAPFFGTFLPTPTPTPVPTPTPTPVPTPSPSPTPSPTPAPTPTPSPTPTPTTVPDGTQAKIVGIGDSIMRGLGADYAALSKLGYPTSVTIENRGQDNHTIWMAAYDAQAGSGWGSAAGSWDSAKTNVLVFQRATNDLGKNNGISADIAYQDMAGLIRLYQNQGFYVAVETCLPRYAEWTSAKEAERIKYNNLVRQNAMGADLIIDSASDSVIGDSGDLSGKTFQTSYPAAATTYYTDGVHLTTAGQDRKAIIYKNALPPLLTLAPRAKGQFPATVGAATYTAQPTVSPTSGGTGQTFTANPGTISNGRVYSRNWLLNGSSISTGVTAVPNATGTLTYQEVPYGLGGGNGSASNVISVTVGSTPTPSPTPTPTPAPTPTPTPTSSGDPATSRTTAMTYGTGKFSQGRTAGTVLIPTSAVPASPTLPITFEIWAMLPTSATAEAWLMCTDRAPGNNNTWGLLCQSDGKMRLTASNMFDQSKQLSTTFVMRDGAWHHYRVRLYAASIEVDVDGVLTGQLAIAPVTGAQMVLGEIYQNQYGVGWTGSFDEFAAFSGARTGAAPTAAYVGNETNLLALYHLDGNLLSGKQ